MADRGGGRDRAGRRFIPAFRLHLLTPLYDWMCRTVGLGDALRRWQVGLVPGRPRRLLEVGCGTAELLLALGRRDAEAELIGLDPDPEVLARASGKFARIGRRVTFVQGRAERLPFPDGRFDLVLSSLMLHHLDTPAKIAALREWGRVLDPAGGAILLVDFGVPRSWPARLLAGVLGRFEETGDNFGGRVPELLREAGLAFEEVGVYGSVIVAYRARALPDAGAAKAVLQPA